ncbi:MAG: hypothetical protein AABN33_23385 [Acidobacteriota bacterium]
MKPLRRLFVISAFALMLAHPLAIAGQWNNKPYTEWSEKEAMKLLNESPWGQSHSFTDMSKMFSTGPRGLNPRQTEEANLRQVNFRIRFLSARPIRKAFVRAIELKQKGQLPKQFADQLKAFVTNEFRDYIVVVVDFDSTASTGEYEQVRALFNNRTTADLKNNTYLQVGGKRVFLDEYQSPKSDGLGARLVFPRLVEGKPWITEASEDIHFYCELSTTYKLDTRYKIKDMIFQGKLEY